MTEQPTMQQRPPLRRSSSDRMIGGVCGGLARTLGIDPVVVRVIVAILGLVGGAGIAAYIIAWILIPDDDGSNALQEAKAGRSRFTQVFLVLVLALAAVSLLDHTWPGLSGALGLLIFLLVAVVAWQAFGSEAWGRTTVQHDSGTPHHNITVEKGPEGQTVTVQSPAGTTVIKKEPKSVLGRIVWNALVVAFGIMLGLNLTGTTDLSGRTVVAVLLGIVAIGLIVSAFVGRARGLIALGLVLTLVSLPMHWADTSDVGDRTWAPTASVLGTDQAIQYDLGVGNAILDLRPLAATLSDSATAVTVRVHVGAGDVQVLLPPATELGVDGHVQVGLGQVQLPGQSLRDGSGVNEDFVIESPGAHIALDIQLGVGNVEVRHA